MLHDYQLQAVHSVCHADEGGHRGVYDLGREQVPAMILYSRN